MFRAQNRYKVCSGHDVADYIAKTLEGQCSLSDYQKSYLRQQLGDSGCCGNLNMDVQFYKWEDEGIEGQNWIWRLTFPIYLIFCIFANFIVFPLHWVATGQYSLGKDSKFLAFAYKWHDKIFKWRRK